MKTLNLEILLLQVRVESTIRYAMYLLSDDQFKQTNEGTQGGGHSTVRKECLHVQDILFDMLEDLEDNVKQLGSTDFGRGANLKIDKSSLSCALGLLNRAIRIQLDDGPVFSMNSDFIDAYAEHATANDF